MMFVCKALLSTHFKSNAFTDLKERDQIVAIELQKHDQKERIPERVPFFWETKQERNPPK